MGSPETDDNGGVGMGILGGILSNTNSEHNTTRDNSSTGDSFYTAVNSSLESFVDALNSSLGPDALVVFKFVDDTTIVMTILPDRGIQHAGPGRPGRRFPPRGYGPPWLRSSQRPRKLACG